MAPQTQSILRNGINARSMMKNQSARSIMKRPAPLPLSPVMQTTSQVQVAQFSVLLSPSARGLKSPHVHFPPSPSKLAATFTAYSPTSYDRGPISVSPNLLLMPGWGERVYSPSVDGFKLSANPRAFRTLAYQASPVITDFEDPRSPKLQPLAKVKESRASSNTIRFATFTSVQTERRPIRSLDKALSSYPRSPFPSAPISPSESKALQEDEMDTRGRRPSRSGVIPSAPERARARAASVQERSRKNKNKKGLTLGPRVSDSLMADAGFTSTPSPLGRSIFSPAVASLNRHNKPAPLAIDSLTEQFWDALSLAENSSSAASGDFDEPMVTALEYPESAVEYEEKLDMTLRSAAQPPMMYAGADGALWSPGLPRPGAAIEKLRESLMSPAVGKSFGRSATLVRKDFTAPSPNDPFAAFPSFAAAIEMGSVDGALQYPPRVALERA